ncbi:MAG: hypothetical protein WCV62_03385 [Candidatus Peribacteraceae bacterium]|jgi:hypothetical protein
MRYHLIVYVPVPHAQAVRDALTAAGAGRLGNYDGCSFSSRGTGRFRPLKGAKPAIGTVGKMEEVEEERIEVMVDAASEYDLKAVVAAVKKAHPYEEPAIHVMQMADVKES